MDSFALGRQPWRTFDPFLFCAYHNDTYPAGDANMAAPTATFGRRNIGSDFSYIDGWSMYHGSTVPGFPAHPHRGFETVTVSRRGIVDHFDSLGMAGRYGDGDVQWMTAGRGIQHCEMMPLRAVDRPNPMELFQIWLNLPKKDKMAPPTAVMFWNEDVPVVRRGSSAVRVVAGSLDGVAGQRPPPHSLACDPAAEIGIFEVDVGGEAVVLPRRSEGVRRTAYVVRGDVTLDGTAARAMTGYVLDGRSALSIGGVGFVLVLEGRPLGEPVAQHGPFVMNSAAEIREAFADYQRTEFGGWPWKERDPVHPRSVGRHVRHADGTEDRPRAP